MLAWLSWVTLAQQRLANARLSTVGHRRTRAARRTWPRESRNSMKSVVGRVGRSFVRDARVFGLKERNTPASPTLRDRDFVAG